MQRPAGNPSSTPTLYMYVRISYLVSSGCPGGDGCCWCFRCQHILTPCSCLCSDIHLHRRPGASLHPLQQTQMETRMVHCRWCRAIHCPCPPPPSTPTARLQPPAPPAQTPPPPLAVDKNHMQLVLAPTATMLLVMLMVLLLLCLLLVLGTHTFLSILLAAAVPARRACGSAH
jgi:hypothetical protein